MSQKGKTFDPGFKLQVVQMIREQGLSVAQVCREMSLGETTVRRWLAQFDVERSGQARIDKPLTANPQRIRHLEAENRQLRQDNDLVKRQRNFFSVNPHEAIRFGKSDHDCKLR